MPWEVEQKFRLTDEQALRNRLTALGAAFESPVEQIDHYFKHPSRDFAQTDEAFRLRQLGPRNFVTYKGPKIDQTTKTRRELELELPAGPSVGRQFAELFEALGFRAVGIVRKLRQKGTLDWQGHSVEIAWDDVEGLGRFLELEIATGDDGLPQAKQSLLSLTQHLGLPASERRSYLELLLYESP